ncbi:MAG: rRNA maturation RNase YbeY [Candidatus Margulisiibacteriota bacterium]
MLKKLNKIARAVAAAEKAKGRIEAVFVSDAVIRKLNKKFRKADRATDVLSFEIAQDGILGQIVISKDTAKRNAKRYGVSFDEEVKRLAVHGALHLAGYDHAGKSDRMLMREKEDHYAKKIR